MTNYDIGLLIICVFMILVFVKPLGWYMSQVYNQKRCGLDYLLAPVEQIIYRICGIQPENEMDWKAYLVSMLVLNLLGTLFLYVLLRLQFYLPLNPQHVQGLSPSAAFNAAISFATNTNWQTYAGEKDISYFTQMVGFTAQNFISASALMALLVALIRGITRSETSDLGNFWVDFVRGIIYILMPLAIIVAVFLSSQGVIQNLKPYEKVTLLQPISYQNGSTTIKKTEQFIPMGPVASQEAIKQLGTCGGGFFATNSAHPFENPTPLSDLVELLAVILIPAAFCYMFGVMAEDKRQGWAILIVMMLLFVACASFSIIQEQQGNPSFSALGVSVGPNMEGKELRFGSGSPGIWLASATPSSGSVNSMLDSLMPLSGFIPLWLMHLGEFVFGGVGTGLMRMLIFIMLTVFIAGLMVGRTPEYLGKKIQPFEMKMISFITLFMPMIVVVLTAVGLSSPLGINAIGNPGPHGFTEVLYAFTSMGSNNGSAFSGLNVKNNLYNVAGGLEMLFVRYWTVIAVLALAGSLAKKKRIPSSVGTLSTHSVLFMILLVVITCLVGALTFFPPLALGPIVEHFLLWGPYA